MKLLVFIMLGMSFNAAASDLTIKWNTELSVNESSYSQLVLDLWAGKNVLSASGFLLNENGTGLLIHGTCSPTPTSFECSLRGSDFSIITKANIDSGHGSINIKDYLNESIGFSHLTFLAVE